VPQVISGAVPEPVLSVVMPCYNEAATVLDTCRRVLASPYTRELIVVDDASIDESASLVESLDDKRVVLVRQPYNQGKGAALRRGFEVATAPFVVVQDADREYDPVDYEQLLGPLLDGSADVVFGSRFMSGRPHRVLYFWHSIGNRLLTIASNAFTNLNLTDM
jgi:glycosyltransferase involved in cell wall biosynthesis